MSKDFYFMRHGQTDWNKQNIYMGSKDIPLNSDGIKQAESVIPLLPPSIQYIVSSPLQRAVQTSEIVSRGINKPIKIIDGLKECYWGDEEGQVINYEDTRAKWLSGGLNICESPEEFEARVMNALREALQLPEPILIISHGGVYSGILRALGRPNHSLKNCELILTHFDDLIFS